MKVKDASKSYVTSTVSMWNYDMGALPSGTKCLLLNFGGCACIGSVTQHTRRDFAAWAPLPKRDKDMERQLGLKI